MSAENVCFLCGEEFPSSLGLAGHRCALGANPHREGNHSRGPWIEAIAATENEHDLQGRRYWRGRLVGQERDDFGRLKTIIEGTATMEDWTLMKAAPELLAACQAALQRHADVAYAGGYTACGCDVCETLRAAISKAAVR